MKRDTHKLHKQDFDIIILGGGIHGATTAWQCAAQGLKVVLLEKEDFGCKTSANSLKIIHGGFRYLQHLNFKRMRESILSRRILSLVAPHNIQPLGCLIPNHGYGMRNSFLMKIALFLYNLVAFDRNKGIGDECIIPKGGIISRKECEKKFPLINWAGKTGGTLWYDALANNSERLTLSFVQLAAKMGATVVNYAEVKDLLIENKKIKGCTVYDSIGNNEITVTGKTIILTGGANNDKFLQGDGHKDQTVYSWAKAVNIIVKKKLLDDFAIGLTGKDDYSDKDALIKKKGRFFFFVPWRQHTMIGTTYAFSEKQDETPTVSEKDIHEIVAEVNEIFPGASLSLSDVSKCHAGLLPAYPKVTESDVQLVKETVLTEIGTRKDQPIRGLFSLLSVKYTTAPIVAQQTAQKVCKYLKHDYQSHLPFITLGEIPVTNKSEDEFKYTACFYERYGLATSAVLKYFHKGGQLLNKNPVFFLEEIDYLVEEEMVATLADVVFRRTELATAECPEHSLLQKISQRLGEHFDWDETRVAEEVSRVEETFKWTNKQSITT
ncbi:MAG: FAD-dependent oxidoreductase [Bacteroidetes bacterium]|nr:FAD-dependent oxidoreductase [Bacteroidota bacterium]